MAHPTAPLTPPDANLQDFPRMMIHIGRLRGSAFDATLDDAAWRAGVNLWMTSWHQVPAGSLPSDEPGLMKAAGLHRDTRTWRRIRTLALHGWILCDDGLYYHPVVAETVLEAWLTKLLRRLSSGHGNARRHGYAFDVGAVTADIRRAAEMLERLDPKAEVLSKPTVQKARAGLPPGDEDVPPGADRERKTSQGKGREGKTPPKPPQGASINIDPWAGPADVRAIVQGRLYEQADGYLSYFTWRELPEKALVTKNPTMLAKLKDCTGDLKAIGWKLVLEKGRAA